METKEKTHRGKAKAGHGSNIKGRKSTSPKKKWSGKVTEESDAMDLKQEVFKLHDPDEIAGSIKKSAEKSTRRKSNPFRSAMSMLNFYINRAGKNLSVAQKKILEKAKQRLRAKFEKEEPKK